MPSLFTGDVPATQQVEELRESASAGLKPSAFPAAKAGKTGCPRDVLGRGDEGHAKKPASADGGGAGAKLLVGEAENASSSSNNTTVSYSSAASNSRRPEHDTNLNGRGSGPQSSPQTSSYGTPAEETASGEDEDFVPRRVLLTGGCGFIGSNVLCHLVRKYAFNIFSSISDALRCLVRK
eukprot:gene66-295_t